MQKPIVEQKTYDDLSLEELTALKDGIIRKMASYDKMITMFKSAKAHYQENIERIDNLIREKNGTKK